MKRVRPIALISMERIDIDLETDPFFSSRIMHCLLLLTVVAAQISGIEAHSIYACSGESVLLFQNMSKTVSGTDIFLYKNSLLIETWSKSKTEREEERVSYDDYGNIWMRSINISDEANYTVLQNIGDQHPGVHYEVRLIVLVPPQKTCRPQLKRDGNTLIASLETGAACGNSGATAFWVDYPYKALESQAEANLSPGREKGTYYACIETPALRCAGGSKSVDFCSSLTIDESLMTGETATYSVANTTVAIITVFSVMGFCLLFMTGVACFLLIQLNKKHRQPNSCNQVEDGMMELPLLLNPTI